MTTNPKLPNNSSMHLTMYHMPTFVYKSRTISYVCTCVQILNYQLCGHLCATEEVCSAMYLYVTKWTEWWWIVWSIDFVCRRNIYLFVLSWTRVFLMCLSTVVLKLVMLEGEVYDSGAQVCIDCPKCHVL